MIAHEVNGIEHGAGNAGGDGQPGVADLFERPRQTFAGFADDMVGRHAYPIERESRVMTTVQRRETTAERNAWRVGVDDDHRRSFAGNGGQGIDEVRIATAGDVRLLTRYHQHVAVFHRGGWCRCVIRLRKAETRAFAPGEQRQQIGPAQRFPAIGQQARPRSQHGARLRSVQGCERLPDHGEGEWTRLATPVAARLRHAVKTASNGFRRNVLVCLCRTGAQKLAREGRGTFA